MYSSCEIIIFPKENLARAMFYTFANLFDGWLE